MIQPSPADMLKALETEAKAIFKRHKLPIAAAEQLCKIILCDDEDLTGSWAWHWALQVDMEALADAADEVGGAAERILPRTEIQG